VEAWATALRLVFDEFDGHPPVWGKYDCCQFIARYVQELTGVDHAKQFAYDSKLAAARILSESGGIEGLLAKFLGAPKTEADPGDIVLCSIDINGDIVIAPGITNGHYVLTVHPEEGVGIATLNCIQAAWTCPKH
jgi:hypothetical protein